MMTNVSQVEFLFGFLLAQLNNIIILNVETLKASSRNAQQITL